MSQKPKGSHTGLTVVLIILILVMIAATAFLIYMSLNLANKEPDLAPTQAPTLQLPQSTRPAEAETTQETTVPPTTEAPEPEHVVATATVSTQGDLLMHKPVFNSCKSGDGYDFSSIFQYSKDLIQSYDYAIINLETTFGGDKYVYQGNPAFNCPDSLAASVKDTGYEMLLTANNHSGDTMGDGIIRTIETVRNAGLATLGSQLPGENRYSVVDVNGIKIGMVCYTWTFSTTGTSFSLNGLTPIKDEGQMNYFSKKNPDKLYTELKPIMEGMKADGAEVTVIFIHWGEEYQTTENAAQDKMAQKLCDMGFDVIVGGHPHVVEPVALLQSSENPEHKTYCIYSLGNAVSNQRAGISDKFSRYTESGVLFTTTFEKYSDGKVYVSGVDAIPTWVNMHSKNGHREYNILPLLQDQEEQWQEAFQLTDGELNAAKDSYQKTMKLVSEGLNACQEELAQAKLDREAYYLNLAEHPELADVPAETRSAAVPETTVPEAA